MADPAAPAPPAPAGARRADLARALAATGRFAPPPNLPIAARHDDLLAAIRDHQVVIVAGETGSGKSTQLPKICLELGRGTDGWIGHTQPRRVAARTIAERIAEELGTELGAAIGYTVRFTDRVGESTLVKVMTDGILLAEIQHDRMLRRYDTLIIDEAHERSLNIDFLLGYLAQLLPRRSDLKVIVTSATIDTARFAEHFDGAPVIEVSGRTYPVEVRDRPFGIEPGDDRDQVHAVIDAVDELATDGPGDVLVFLSGEREIHDTAEALRRRATSGLEVLPLYARLSAAEQHRIFEPHRRRRIVLSTNVAETSLTVPGVRYVVDAGSARISRYSHRLKVQRLPIEPVSQASANQRAGRCGRVAPGVCIRLYSEDDLTRRSEFTEPEILRTNLASVILQMTALGLGPVDDFPFLDPPDRRAVRDGYALLDELGALRPAVDDEPRRLTQLGRRLARLPIDPRLGRMVIEAERHGCVREVLVIAAALSIQDPRERPTDQRQAADELHRRFDVDGSDFLAYVRLWDHLRQRQQEMSSSQFRRLCRAELLNYLRVREWQDLYSQLRQVAGSLGIRAGTDTGHPDRVHQALLAGLLSHIGARHGTTREYRGARGSTFAIGAGSSLAKKPPRWVMAAELVETNRLWARVVAPIQPEWAERLAGDLVKRSYGEPEWEPSRGRAVVLERATLFGLPIVGGRRVDLHRIDRDGARRLFIRHALVAGEWDARHHFVTHNRELIERLEAMGDRVRRSEAVDEGLVARFFDERIPPDIVSSRHFDRWWRDAQARQPALLDLTPEALSQPDAPVHDPRDYPDTWTQGDVTLALSYRYEPGAADDGVTVHVPLAILDQVRTAGFDWGVPGYRAELVGALVKTLPKDIRRQLVPAAENVRAAVDRLAVVDDDRPLVDALADVLVERSGARVRPNAFDIDRVPAHLRMTFAVDDDRGQALGTGDDLDALRTAFGRHHRAAVAAAAPIAERRGIVTWDLGTVPAVVESVREGRVIRGYPALLDDGDSVSLRVFTRAELQQRVMRAGVRRLLLLVVAPSHRRVERALTNEMRLALSRLGASSPDGLVDDCITACADQVLAAVGDLPWDEASFAAIVSAARGVLTDDAVRAAGAAGEIVVVAADLAARLDRLAAPGVAAAAADMRAQLGRLVRPRFVSTSGVRRLPDVLRYLRGIERRVEKVASDPVRDRQRMSEVVALERRYASFVAGRSGEELTPEIVELGWSFEELRVSVFAQALGARSGVSAAKLARQLDRLGA
jgi:ATP-dependent helicase HrpA